MSYKLCAVTVGSDLYPPPPLLRTTDAIGKVENDVNVNAFAKVQTEFDDVFNHSGDRLGLLKLACRGVPMFVNLDHVPSTAMLDPDVNIQFEIVHHK